MTRRRDFIYGLVSVGGLSSLSGCAGIFNDSPDDNGNDNDDDDDDDNSPNPSPTPDPVDETRAMGEPITHDGISITVHDTWVQRSVLNRKGAEPGVDAVDYPSDGQFLFADISVENATHEDLDFDGASGEWTTTLFNYHPTEVTTSPTGRVYGAVVPFDETVSSETEIQWRVAGSIYRVPIDADTTTGLDAPANVSSVSIDVPDEIQSGETGTAVIRATTPGIDGTFHAHLRTGLGTRSAIRESFTDGELEVTQSINPVALIEDDVGPVTVTVDWGGGTSEDTFTLTQAEESSGTETPQTETPLQKPRQTQMKPDAENWGC